MKYEWYCGCCGNDAPSGFIWCYRCDRHILPARRGCLPGYGLEDRTYFAQHNKPCPFSEID